ncbi:hypothetical protein D3C76_1537290 [compost metagenome]
MCRARQDPIHLTFDDVPLAESPQIDKTTEDAIGHHKISINKEYFTLAPAAQVIRMTEDHKDKDQVGCLEQQIR